MSDKIDGEMLLRILDRLPGVPWAFRLDQATLKSEWLYVSPQLAKIYGVSQDDLQVGPIELMKRLDREDAVRFRELIKDSMTTLAPMTWTGKVNHSSGSIRWIEVQVVYELDANGLLLAYGQTFDITERKRTEQLHSAAIDALPAGVMVMTPDGKFPIYNNAANKYVGSAPEDHGGDLIGYAAVGTFKTDGVTRVSNDELPLLRALAGEEAPEAELIVRNGRPDGEYRVHVKGSPIRDASGAVIAGLVIFHDITGQRALQDELRARNEQLAASEQDKSALIERLRYSINELENPILEIWDDVLAMPIIGVVDARRTADMVQRLLAEVARTQSSFVIIDLTGVEIVDTKTADYLIKLVRKVEIVGARCVLTGIRPAVSETLVDIGVDFGRLTTLRNLKHGLKEALRSARREREGMQREGSEGDDKSDEAPTRTSAQRGPR